MKKDTQGWERQSKAVGGDWMVLVLTDAKNMGVH